MTTDEALERLKQHPDWVLGYGKNYLTDAPGWEVALTMNGEAYERLGFGATVAEAIAVAEIKAAQAEREEAERQADYERRKAEGRLTPLELSSEYTGALWSSHVRDAVERPGVLAGLVDRSFEAAIVEPGVTITVGPGVRARHQSLRL